MCHAAVRVNSISIHSLRMEGDDVQLTPLHALQLFQSTPSAWRETFTASEIIPFSVISIHSLRMEGDLCRPHSR